MALYDNPWYLLSHLEHSLVTSDEPGGMLAEQVFDNDQDHPIISRAVVRIAREQGTSDLLEPFMDVNKLAGDDDEEDEADGPDTFLQREFGRQRSYPRQRSNTVARLQELQEQKKYWADIKIVSYDKKPAGPSPTEQELDELFPKKELPSASSPRLVNGEGEEPSEPNPGSPTNSPREKPKALTAAEAAEAASRPAEPKWPSRPSSPIRLPPPSAKSSLSFALAAHTQRSNPHWAKYASVGCVDDALQYGQGRYHILLDKIDSNDQMLDISVNLSSSVADVIGYIGYKYDKMGREPPLREDYDYSLAFAGDDDDFEFMNFGSLDRDKPISDYNFSRLRLLARPPATGVTGVTTGDSGLGHGQRKIHQVSVVMPDGHTVTHPVNTLKLRFGELQQQLLEKHPPSEIPLVKYVYNMERVDKPGVPLDAESALETEKGVKEFYLVREHSVRPLSSAQVSTGAELDKDMQDELDRLEAHTYREYENVHMHKMARKIPVRLIISEELFQVDPKVQQGMFGEKPFLYQTDEVMACDISDMKSETNWVFKVVVVRASASASSASSDLYSKEAVVSPGSANEDDAASSASGSVNSASTTVEDGYRERTGSGSRGRSRTMSLRARGQLYRKHYFECESGQAKKIHTKLNNLIKFKTTWGRREYNAYREKKKEVGKGLALMR